MHILHLGVFLIHEFSPMISIAVQKYLYSLAWHIPEKLVRPANMGSSANCSYNERPYSAQDLATYPLVCFFDARRPGRILMCRYEQEQHELGGRSEPLKG